MKSTVSSQAQEQDGCLKVDHWPETMSHVNLLGLLYDFCCELFLLSGVILPCQSASEPELILD